MTEKRLFDDWPERYDAWFTMPAGRLVLEYEQGLVLDLLQPASGEAILDAGCGTGIFTEEFLARGAKVVGLDVSLPMLARAREKLRGYPFGAVGGDMRELPFAEAVFDKVVSVTAIEFITDARAAIGELFRVVKKRGCIVVASLNSLSPWATRRKAETARKEDSVFREAIFRSPAEMRQLSPIEGVVRTAVHFRKDEELAQMREIERQGQLRGEETGAFLAARWVKPD